MKKLLYTQKKLKSIGFWCLFVKNTITFYSIFLVYYFTPCFIHSQNLYIPDANFKSFLIKQADININLDKEIQLNEANSFKGIIDCSGLEIDDLTGIEGFRFLKSLDCSQNNLKTLNLAKNDSLKELMCSLNQLKILDLSNNLSLEVLGCGFNFITNLNISKNLNLQELFCHRNSLSVLDVEKIKRSWYKM